MLKYHVVNFRSSINFQKIRVPPTRLKHPTTVHPLLCPIKKNRLYSSNVVSRTSLLSHDDLFDIVIVGGGLIGACMACSIYSSPFLSHLKVALVESKWSTLNPSLSPSRLNGSRIPDFRVVSISPSNVSFLKEIGVWSILEQGDAIFHSLQIDPLHHIPNDNDRHQLELDQDSKEIGEFQKVGAPVPFFNMKVWDREHFGEIEFNSNDLNIPQLGYIVENNALQRAIYSRLVTLGIENKLEGEKKREKERKNGEIKEKIALFCPEECELEPCAVINELLEDRMDRLQIELDYKYLKSDQYGLDQFERLGDLNQSNFGSFLSKIDPNSSNFLPFFRILKLKSGRLVGARLVIGADGGNSGIRMNERIPTSGKLYNQKGLVTIVQHLKSNRTAWQQFGSDGNIIGILPLWDRYSAIVWSVDSLKATELISLDDQAFFKALAKELNSDPIEVEWGKKEIKEEWKQKEIKEEWRENEIKEFWKFPEMVSVQGERGCFQLQEKKAWRYLSYRTVLVGDAAHVIHPMAGQGLNLGIKDVISLTDILIKSVQDGADIGLSHYLQEYEKFRDHENGIMMSGVNALFSLFQAQKEWIKKVRGLGMKIIERVPKLKQALQRRAVGEYMSPFESRRRG